MTEARKKRGGRGDRAGGRAPETVTIELTLDALANGGDAVAHLEHEGARRAVFVHGGVPGDRLRAAVDFTRRPARGKMLELLAPSADRVPPPCPHFDACGACDWMVVARGARHRAYAAEVRALLPAAAQDLPLPFHPAREQLAYRTRARLHVRVSGGRAVVGMHAAESHRPVDVPTCVVLHPALDRARALLAGLFEGAHGEGEAQIALGATLADGARSVVLDVRWPGGALPASFFRRLEEAVKGGLFAGASVRAGDTRLPAVVGDPTPWMRAADDAPLRLATGGFAQASEEDNRSLARRVDAMAREALAKKADDAPRVVELYAGAGNFSVLLATWTRLVTVEGDASACRAAEENLRARDLRARVTQGDAGAFDIPRGTDLVLLDPPRTGAREAVLRIAKAAPRHVLYVACDPPTLGRDLAKLGESGYLVRAVEIFEMFPQTSHVETVVLLERRRGKEDGARAPGGAS